jgi:endonuclease/exonuclease/phosphatase family metal-dependent hydrolase
MWEYNVYEYRLNGKDRIKIMCLYKHPKMNIRADFVPQFKTVLRDKFYLDTCIADPLIIVGDFNIDFNNKDYEYIRQSFQDELGLRPLFENKMTFEYVNKSGSNYVHGFSQLDWCFTNLSQNHWNIHGLVYESWYTDHLPIMLEVEKIN